MCSQGSLACLAPLQVCLLIIYTHSCLDKLNFIKIIYRLSSLGVWELPVSSWGRGVLGGRTYRGRLANGIVSQRKMKILCYMGCCLTVWTIIIHIQVDYAVFSVCDRPFLLRWLVGFMLIPIPHLLLAGLSTRLLACHLHIIMHTHFYLRPMFQPLPASSQQMGYMVIYWLLLTKKDQWGLWTPGNLLQNLLSKVCI